MRNSIRRCGVGYFDGRVNEPRGYHCCVPQPSTPDYDQWVRSLPDPVTSDAIWNVSAYKGALYARRCAWPDSVDIARHSLGQPIARQLYRAVASIGANVADGWSRTSGLDRARFFEYALSSAREAIVWYLAAVPMLRPALTRERLSHLSQLRRLLLVMIQTERRRRGRVMRSPARHRAPGLNSSLLGPIPHRLIHHHHPRFLHELLHAHQEQHCLLPVDDAVIVRERDVHHRANLHLAVDRDGAVLDLVQAEDS